MKIITINTYDPEGRFGMNAERAVRFFEHLKQEAIDEGYGFQFTKAVSVDEFSEYFVTKHFENYDYCLAI